MIRKAVQSVWGILSNANLRGFLTGKIYTGPLKRFCVPGMNCYSCPGALGACPIGAMQSVFDGRRRKFAFYVVGFLAAIGLFVGRFICGWMCLFGLIEELLYMIPVPKIRVPAKIDKILRYFKYPVLIILVFALPFFYRTDVGTGDPFFCKYVCPVGTLEGGIPLILANESLRSSLGVLFGWKAALLMLCILSSMFIYRPFCKYICPLGAFYSLFQKISLLRMRCDKDACIHCGKCAGICPMNVDPSKTPNSAECIRCGECIKACPKKALAFSMRNKPK
ncbi:MAG: 4Fe-4S binding protein [Butyrivibrio sp.]|nr:4Fe-4S binding protein [Butyrivibrio sp.]